MGGQHPTVKEQWAIRDRGNECLLISKKLIVLQSRDR